MASTVPAKSQPLHNFALPHLKWNKGDNHSTSHHHRRRPTKSPSRISHPSSGSPLREPPRQSPLRDSRSSLFHESAMSSPPVRDDLVKYSLLCGESSKQSSVHESVDKFPSRGDSVKQSPIRGELPKQSPKRDLASESEASMRSKSVLIKNNLRNLVSETNKNGMYASNPDRAIEKSEQKLKSKEADAITREKRSRILLKLTSENDSEENQLEESQKTDSNGNENRHATDEAQEDEPKTWNLRPRKPACKSFNGAAGKINGSAMNDKKDPSPSRNSTTRLGEIQANGCDGQKKMKRKLSLSIALSKEEIEEDIFSLTGLKPARRPKKRSKNIQKHLDYLFPGLWLTSITPDSY